MSAQRSPIGMAVNVSGRQLDTDQVVRDIEEALTHSDLDPQALTIEITETTLMRPNGESQPDGRMSDLCRVR
jgi:EAL domain-containing protein (putative c-di-GMP-specific phosphodiesterase class I)